MDGHANGHAHPAGDDAAGRVALLAAEVHELALLCVGEPDENVRTVLETTLDRVDGELVDRLLRCVLERKAEIERGMPGRQ